MYQYQLHLSLSTKQKVYMAECYYGCCILSLLAPADYAALSQNIILDSITTSMQLTIDIDDDMLCEADETFMITVTSMNDSCIVTSSSVPVLIIDNDGMF